MQMNNNNSANNASIDIPINMWIPCKICKKTTRHIIKNPEDCQKKAIYNCFSCLNEYVLCKEFYALFYSCVINDNDSRIIYDGPYDKQKHNNKNVDNQKLNPILDLKSDINSVLDVKTDINSILKSDNSILELLYAKIEIINNKLDRILESSSNGSFLS